MTGSILNFKPEIFITGFFISCFSAVFHHIKTIFQKLKKL